MISGTTAANSGMKTPCRLRNMPRSNNAIRTSAVGTSTSWSAMIVGKMAARTAGTPALANPIPGVEASSNRCPMRPATGWRAFRSSPSAASTT